MSIVYFFFESEELFDKICPHSFKEADNKNAEKLLILYLIDETFFIGIFSSLRRSIVVLYTEIFNLFIFLKIAGI